jgi:hypothetical protein
VLMVSSQSYNSCLVNAYSTAQVDLIRNRVISGMGLLLNNEWGASCGQGTAPIANGLGVTWNGNSNVGWDVFNANVNYDPANPATLFSGVAAWEEFAGSDYTMDAGVVARTNSGIPALIENVYGTGCFVIIGDSNWIADNWIDAYNNRKLAFNAFNLLNGCSSNVQNDAFSAGETLTYTAQTTIDGVRDVAAVDLADGLQDGGDSALNVILGLFGPVTKGLSKAKAISLKVLDEAQNQAIVSLTDLALNHSSYKGFVKSWVDKGYKPMRTVIYKQRDDYAAFVQSHQVSWHPEYSDIVNRWKEKIRNEPNNGVIWRVVPYFPYLMPGTFQLEHIEFTIFHSIAGALNVVIIVLLVLALLIVIIGSIVASGGAASVGWVAAVGSIMQIFTGLNIASIGAGVAACALSLSVVFMGAQASYFVQTDHQKALHELTEVLPNSVASSISQLQTTAQKVDGGISLKTSLTNSAGQAANPLIETYVFNTSGHLVSIMSNQPILSAGQSTKIKEDLALPPGIYHIVTAAHARDHLGLAVSTPMELSTSISPISMQVTLDHSLVSAGTVIHARITLANTGTVASGNLALFAQYDGGKNGKAWEVNLEPGTIQTVKYDFTPTMTSLLAVALEGEAGLQAEAESGYVVGSGAILAINMTPASVYQPGGSVEVQVTGTDPGTLPTNGVLTWTTTRTDLDIAQTIKTGSVNLSVNAGGSQQVTTIWLDNAVPGDYTTQLSLDGLPRASYSFSVQAADTLFAGLTSSCSECTINIPATISLTVTNQSFGYVDPDSVTVTVTTPSGSIQSLAITRISTGHYRGIYTPGTNGTYFLQAGLTKANDQVIPTDMTFFTTQQSTLSENVSGDVFLKTASPVTVTVTNELSVPIAGASVSISNGSESLHGLTDIAGQVIFTLMPQDLTGYSLVVEKPGFVSANDEISVTSTADKTPPAIFVNVPALTNQNPVTVNGQTEPGAQVSIAGSPVPVDAQGAFSVTLALMEGENEVHASAEDAAANIGTSDYEVILDTTPPSLVVNSPVDQSKVTTETIPVSGTTDVGAALMVYGIRVDLTGDGSFFTNALMVPGQNNVVITATDAAGNVSTITRMVYQPKSPKPFNKIAPVKSATNKLLDLALSWEASSGATRYEYCISKTNPCSNWKTNGTVTSVAVNGLSPATTYYWHVRAVNKYGKTFSNAIKADWSFKTAPLPGAFKKITLKNGITNQSASITLSWGTSKWATRYEYCYGTTNPCTNWTNNGTSTSLTLKNLAANTTYYWHVRAVNIIGSTYSNASKKDWSFKTGLPGAFKKIAPAKGATKRPTTLTLSWGTSTGATEYAYCYGTSNPCSNWTYIGASTSVVVHGLNANTTYYWNVAALNSFGYTYANASSLNWSFKTKP